MPPFAGYADFTDCVAQNQDKESPEGFCAWLHHQVTGEWPSAVKTDQAAKEHPDLQAYEFGGPFVMKDARKQIAYGAVLVPGETDLVGDVLTKEKVADCAHSYMETFRLVDRQHDLEKVDAVPVESYLTPVPLEVTIKGQTVTLPSGTWILGTKIRDKAVWKAVETGELQGYSIMGVRRKDWEALSGIEPVLKAGSVIRTSIAGLGNDDIVVPFVSLCRDPIVPKALFFALKSKPTLRDRIRALVVAKEGRTFSAANLQRLQRIKKEIEEMLAIAESERSSEAEDEASKEEKVDEQKVVELIEKSLQPLSDKLTALGDAVAALKAPPPSPPKEEEEVGALKARVTELEAAVKAKDEELGKFKASIEAKLTAIAAKARVGSRGPAGQDEAPPSPPREPVRDALGRRLQRG